jgi:hypothetical protein
MTARTIKDYEPGTELPEIAITVLDLLETATTAANAVYWVRHECCGLERKMTRRVMQQRFRDGSKKCLPCGRATAVSLMHRVLRDKHERRKTEPTTDPLGDYGVTPPAWPVPKSVPIGVYTHWYDRAWSTA